jgi:hypothetical protein
MRSYKYFCVFLLFVLMFSSASAENSNNLLTDINILYLYDHNDRINWPLIYYFSSEAGCHVSLVTVRPGPVFKHVFLDGAQYNVTSSKYFVPDSNADFVDSILADLYRDYLPDIVISTEKFISVELQMLENKILNEKFDSAGIYAIRKYYRRAENSDSVHAFFNRRQYLNEYYEEISKMARSVAEMPPDISSSESYTSYTLIRTDNEDYKKSPSFLYGIDKLKFDRIIEKYIESSTRQMELKSYSEKYVGFLKRAIHQQGLNKIGSMLSAMTELDQIRQTLNIESDSGQAAEPLIKYINKTAGVLQSAIFLEAGVEYNGAVIIRETPEGKVLKFISTINNNGFLTISAGYVELKTPWSDSIIIIDNNWVEIEPNSSLIREYTLDINPAELKSISEFDLKFIGKVKYSGNEVSFVYLVGAQEMSAISVEFIPDFLIVKPLTGGDVDHLVQPTALKALIRKPTEFSSVVKIDVDSPPEILSGAFKKELKLEAGQRAVELEIPLVVTKSTGDMPRRITVRISKDDKVLASAVATVRAMNYDIPEKFRLALLPGTNGLLEDILIETSANYKTVSERYLSVGNFYDFDALLLGSECFRNYHQLELVSDKVKEFIDYGGTVIIFGQPDEWRDDLMPISIVSSEMRTSADDIEIMNEKHDIFSSRYKLRPADMINNISKEFVSFPGIVFPGERIIGSGGAGLLTISHIGRGRLIYCGLPILQMIKKLDSDALKFFSNLLYYINK